MSTTLRAEITAFAAAIGTPGQHERSVRLLEVLNPLIARSGHSALKRIDDLHLTNAGHVAFIWETGFRGGFVDLDDVSLPDIVIDSDTPLRAVDHWKLQAALLDDERRLGELQRETEEVTDRVRLAREQLAAFDWSAA